MANQMERKMFVTENLRDTYVIRGCLGAKLSNVFVLAPSYY